MTIPAANERTMLHPFNRDEIEDFCIVGMEMRLFKAGGRARVRVDGWQVNGAVKEE